MHALRCCCAGTILVHLGLMCHIVLQSKLD
jgi:hypothetical protein